ncbi:MAG: hypothetical protein FWF45_00180 [Coriobacteriia bacterium]|nr:hypothetical protein [Coriobacteriia bacterium]
MSRTKTDAPFLRVALVLRTKGVNGELLVRAEPEAPLLPGGHETYYLAPPLLDDKMLHLSHAAATPQALVLRFAEIDDRQKAHEVVGRALLLRTEELTEAELAAALACSDGFPEQGYEVFSDAGEALGILNDRIETGANLVWVVVSSEGGELLLPVIEDLQICCDEEQRRITVHLLEGLRELNR